MHGSWSFARRIAAHVAGVCCVYSQATATPEKAGEHNAAYEHCLGSIKRDPQSALAEAEKWSASGGGAAALDCAALALVQLKRFGEAAQALENAARSTAAGAPKNDLLDQAG